MKHRIHIFWFKLYFVLTKIVECFFDVVKKIPMLFRLHYNIINISFDILSDLRV
jgi:hypothetical protein